MRIRHIGAGKTVASDDLPGESPDDPHQGPVRAARKVKLKQPPREWMRPINTTGNGYRHGPLLDLGPDQCRFTIRENTMCGALVSPGSSWCAEHRKIVSPAWRGEA